MITTRKKHIEEADAVRAHRRAAGEVWTRLAEAWHLLNEEYDYYLNKGDAMALFATGGMTKRVKSAWNKIPIDEPINQFKRNPFVNDVMRQAGVQQRQQVVRRFYGHVDTFFNELLPQWKENGRDPDERPKPPYKPKQYARTDWVHNRIEKDSDTLRLKTGRGLDEITIEWPHPEPRAVQLVWDDGAGKPMVCCQYDSEKQDLPDGLIRDRLPNGDEVVGVDLGELYMAAIYDGSGGMLFNGGRLRELRSLQNDEKEWFQQRIDRKEKGSNRWWKLVNAKNRRLREIRNQIDDYLHKMSTRLVEECWNRGAATIVIGDLTGIRDGMDYGTEMNQRLHQWAFRQFVDLIEYKADRYGIETVLEPERGTSKTCPQCGGRNPTSTRRYRCTSCGFECHRDMVGAMNIRAKYQDPDGWTSGHLEADRATATASQEAQGTPTGGQLGLFERARSGEPRATLRVESPVTVDYEPHMSCVLKPPDSVSEG